MFHAKVRAATQLPMLKRLFPSYKGRTVYLVEGESAHIHDYWDEGSRAIPMLFHPTVGRFLSCAQQWNRLFTLQVQGNPYNACMGTLKLESGIALCEHVFSGTRQYLRVTLHPIDFAQLKQDWI